MFPTRDQFVEHLDRHAHEDGIDLRLATRVDRIERSNGGWALETSAGEVRTPQVVVATGYESEPLVPAWPGRDVFGGELIHSREYRNAVPFADRVVLVVGPGCSGMEIAYDLAEGGARTVWLSARTPPNIVLREGPGGLPGDLIAVVLLHLPARFGDAVARFGRKMDMGDLTEYGLPVPEEGVMSRHHRTGQAPAILDMEVIEAIKARRVEIVPGVESLDETGVQLTGGSRVEPDLVICATGYRRKLEPLVGHLDVLDERGMPRSLAERAPAPGMRFVGYVPRPGALGYMGKEARRAARAIASELS
jgi:cation diffusion facilitator CzcD-associated flavoprotein CzcO